MGERKIIKESTDKISISKRTIDSKSAGNKSEASVYLEPDKILDVLKHRKEELQFIYDILEKKALNEPAGGLRISKKGNSYQYYFIENEQDTIGKYISKKHMKQICALAQKAYNNKLRKEVLREIYLIDTMMNKYNPTAIEEIFDKCTPGRQALIDPVFMPNEIFAREWLGEEYQHMLIAEEMPFFATKQGEKVRSKTEMIIADKLYEQGVLYKYEYPLKLKNGIEVHPDFVCLNMATRKEVVWEHFGMVDNFEYATNMVKKINSYIASGYVWGETFIASFEGSRSPIDVKYIDNMINIYLK
ncbi:MAG: hypothetical protein IJ655_04715 [Lachnospiraceae bacterium]|nr:hypothetical protein [Lachnospiraceae bacterium]